MALVQTLRAYTIGKLSREQLLAEFDGPLHEDLADTRELSRAIDEISRWEGFPDDITDVLKSRLADLSGGAFSGGSSASGSIPAYRGSDPFIFICYAHADSDAVQSELKWLNQRGVNCWYDEGISGGSEWSEELARRIIDCDLFVYFVTPVSISTENCRRELAFALDYSKKTLAIHLDDTELPPGLRLSLSNRQAIMRYGLNAEDYERKFLEVLERLDLMSLTSFLPERTTVAAPLNSPPADRELEVGDVLAGRFELLEVLGAGGMSIVFKAKDLKSYDQAPVAVKVLNPGFSQHPDSMITLKREVAKTSRLVDRNIVNVRDFNDSGPHAFMWMEYIPGRTLAERLRDPNGPPISPAEAMLIVRGMVNALSYAHDLQRTGELIVHADFKPGNVMLTSEPVTDADQVRVIDFGIARAVRKTDEFAEPTVYNIRNLHAHTPTYASPELIANKEADPRDDIYALGCITHEMLTGRHPFDRSPANEALAKNLQVERRKGMTREQHLAIKHALAFNRAERTPSAAAFLRELTNGAWQTPGWATMAGGAILILLLIGFSVPQVVKWMGSSPEQLRSTFRDCASCPEMVVVQPGQFTQGSNDNNALSSETPARVVTIDSPIAVGTGEISVAEFRQFSEGTNLQELGCHTYGSQGWSFKPDANWSNSGFPQTDSHPVVCVSWRDANGYAQWLSDLTGNTYRLPTESEWEYFTKANTGSERWFEAVGQTACEAANVADLSAAEQYPDWEVENCDDGHLYTAPIHLAPANPLGLRDTLGNVFEWVQDCWSATYIGAPLDGSARLDTGCAERVLRGGSWFTQPLYSTATFRNRFQEDHRSSSIGFRVVRELKEGD